MAVMSTHRVHHTCTYAHSIIYRNTTQAEHMLADHFKSDRHMLGRIQSEFAGNVNPEGMLLGLIQSSAEPPLQIRQTHSKCLKLERYFT